MSIISRHRVINGKCLTFIRREVGKYVADVNKNINIFSMTKLRCIQPINLSKKSDNLIFNKISYTLLRIRMFLVLLGVFILVCDIEGVT